jgi:hypothetical protein
MFDSCLRTATKSDLFMLPVEKENGVLYRDELGQVLQKAKQVVRSSYELTRRRATEPGSLPAKWLSLIFLEEVYTDVSRGVRIDETAPFFELNVIVPS